MRNNSIVGKLLKATLVLETMNEGEGGGVRVGKEKDEKETRQKKN